jgi:hypothetical protein
MSGINPNFELNKEYIRQILSSIQKKYETNLSFMAPELREEADSCRNPVKVIEKMIDCIPLEESNRFIIYSLINYTINVPKLIRNIIGNWWIPMSTTFLPEIIGETDTPWKRQMVGIWNNSTNLQEPSDTIVQGLVYHDAELSQAPLELLTDSQDPESCD